MRTLRAPSAPVALRGTNTEFAAKPRQTVTHLASVPHEAKPHEAAKAKPAVLHETAEAAPSRTDSNIRAAYATPVASDSHSQLPKWAVSRITDCLASLQAVTSSGFSIVTRRRNASALAP